MQKKFYLAVPNEVLRSNDIDMKEVFVQFVLTKYQGKFSDALMTIEEIVRSCDYTIRRGMNEPINQNTVQILSKLVEKGFIEMNVSANELTSCKQAFRYTINQSALPHNCFTQLNEEEFDAIVCESKGKAKTGMLHTYLYVKSFYPQSQPEENKSVRSIMCKSIEVISNTTGIDKKSLLSYLGELCDKGLLRKCEIGRKGNNLIQKLPSLYLPSYMKSHEQKCVDFARRILT